MKASLRCLSAALLTTVFRDIRVSRRSGDAANALQVADAGLNDAVKSLRNAVATAKQGDALTVIASTVQPLSSSGLGRLSTSTPRR